MRPLPTPTQAGLFLWHASLSERIAVGTFHRLERGSLLRGLEDQGLIDDGDRRRVQQFAEEEMRHGDLLRACARQYSHVRPDQTYPIPAWISEPVALATLAFAEQFATPGFPAAVRVFAALGDTATRDAWGVIAREEAGHVAWGKRVLAAIRHAGGSDAAAAHEVFKARHVRNVCKALAQEHPWMLRR